MLYLIGFAFLAAAAIWIVFFALPSMLEWFLDLVIKD